MHIPDPSPLRLLSFYFLMYFRADPNNTNVYIGNIAPDTPDADLRRQFNSEKPILPIIWFLNV